MRPGSGLMEAEEEVVVMGVLDSIDGLGGVIH